MEYLKSILLAIDYADRKLFNAIIWCDHTDLVMELKFKD